MGEEMHHGELAARGIRDECPRRVTQQVRRHAVRLRDPGLRGRGTELALVADPADRLACGPAREHEHVTGALPHVAGEDRGESGQQSLGAQGSRF